MMRRVENMIIYEMDEEEERKVEVGLLVFFVPTC